ncbi:MarR family transcriptional regulator [Actinocrinis puniceicyclus]|uniref:MarR family transcriptional regulator n=1 Tax=Actinocrinis puniceicyclus TaxID=977794 RepID=A0A8J7WGH3_9ACTN|nr:MarR family transcriptional regulator [Actinocrinis puniceicyclus]MBS2961831.1 MarR family transcriptional regulator [Actinocrinis puniceicyclus]
MSLEDHRPAGATATRWLSDVEQHTWRAWLEVMRLLPALLEDRLHERHDLNLTDYQVLVELSEAEESRLRMTELANRTSLSKSRLSHQIGRMEKAGLVERQDCPSDRRGSFAVITQRGWGLIRAAAPRHVDDVRELFVDLITPEQIDAVGQAMEAIAQKLRQSPGTGCANALAERDYANRTTESAPTTRQ